MGMEKFENNLKAESLKEQVLSHEDLDLALNEIEKEIMLPAYVKAMDILDNESIKPEKFTDTYKEETMAEHRKYVENCKKLFERNRMEELPQDWIRAEVFGKTLEGLIHDQINKGVFGENVRGVSTTDYDDIYAGIDEVLERQGEDGTSYLGFALDFTFGNPTKKIKGIVDNINSGRLNDVYYYESPFGETPSFHGKLQGVPKVIVGMDNENLLKLTEQWIKNDQEAITQNHIFLGILKQIKEQAEVFGIYAKRTNKTEIATRYATIEKAMSIIFNERRETLNISMLDSNVTSDKVTKSIRNEISKLL